jgi:hypothetical protein
VGRLPLARSLFCYGAAAEDCFVASSDEGWGVVCCWAGVVWAIAETEKLGARKRSAIWMARFTVAEPRWANLV